MKRFTLILILGIIYLNSYSQFDEIVILKEGDIKVYFLQDRQNDTIFEFQWIRVEGKARRSDKLFSEKWVIYWDKTVEFISNDLKDSLFQNLYNWIKDLDDFATNPDINNPVVKPNYKSYHLIAHKSHISFMSPVFFTIDQKGYGNHGMWVKMKVKTIREFKKSLIDYITSHNISIKL